MSTTEKQFLQPQHQALIDGSAISPEVASARGYYTETTKSKLRQLGFSELQARVPTLVIPVYGVSGEITTYQARPDQPRIKDGKALKYETPAGSRMALDVPLMVRPSLGDPKRDLFITEGARKADAAVSHGLCCIALLGVWNWRGTNDQGGKTALPDWESIALKERSVYICFDSDAMTKKAVYTAMERLKGFLEHRGATVRLIYLPQNEAGDKIGLDDYLAADYGVDALMALASTELRPLPHEEADAGYEVAGAYRMSTEGIWWKKPTRDGETLVRLTNFHAKIVAEVIEDDGAEEQRMLELETLLRGRTARFTLPTNEFTLMNWPMLRVGATALVEAGMGTKDNARAAIQSFSQEVPVRTVFCHLGWRKLPSGWVYLHAGGALGPDGPVEGVILKLSDGFQRYQLPDVHTREGLQMAICASLRLLEVAPDATIFPLYAAIWRAAIDAAVFSLHLAGPTGAGKSVLAALAQQHYGCELDVQRLPGSWSSTANALESMAFIAKDALMVVDDFAPGGSNADVNRIHRDADRLLRAQGNSAGRQRLRSDTSQRPARPPRGLIVSTGEDVPRGESLRARMVVIELGPKSLDWTRITVCQQDAAEGRYATAMAGFVQWFATRRDAAPADMKRELIELRQENTNGILHKRVPDAIANLAWGWKMFLAFARDANAIDETQTQGLWQRGWKAFGETAAVQAANQATQEPTTRYIQLLQSAIAAGKAHVTAADGTAPVSATTWGWRALWPSSDEQPQGTRIGWLDGDDLYLDPQSAFAIAQSLANNLGETIPISSRTLHKRLTEKGLLASMEQDRNTLTVRRVLEGTRRNVLHLRKDVVMPSGTAQTAHGASPEGEAGTDGQSRGQIGGQFPPLGLPQTAHENCPHAARVDVDECASTTVGSLGSSGEHEVLSGTDSTARGLTHPEKPCHTCRGTRFYQFLGEDRRRCGTCHPPAPAHTDRLIWTTVDANGGK